MTSDRQAAIDWAREMLAQNFLILDTETTGLGDDATICSLAIINSDGRTVFNALVNPGQLIPQTATNIHGITNGDVNNLPRLHAHIPAIAELLNSRQTVIYNADYDTRLLRQSLSGIYDDVLKYFKPHCAMLWFAQFYGEQSYNDSYRWQKLTKAAAHFGIDTGGAHGAEADCRMTLGVIRGMAEAAE